MIFDEDLCVIQDCATKSPTGMGRFREGVYFADKLASPMVQVNMVGPQNLWHGHLRHPSEQVLS